jgi:hypothetical protein
MIFRLQGFLGLLTLLFIGMKLAHHIDWSWWYVLAPAWVLPFIVLVAFGVLYAVAGASGKS